MPRRQPAPEPSPTPQTPEQLATLTIAFLDANTNVTAAEDGRILFDLSNAKYSVSTQHGRCTLQLWDESRNIVRTIVSANPRGPSTLRLRTQRMGHSRPQTLELTAVSDTRRSPTARDTARTRYAKLLERVLERHMPDWQAEAFHTAMDLERSFGPAYTRGILLRGRSARAVIGVNAQEPQAIIDGILTFGILWLAHLRNTRPKHHVNGLTLFLPRGRAMTTFGRMAWLAGPTEQWQLYELDQETEDLTLRDAADHGNLATRLIHSPSIATAQARFAPAIDRVLNIIPEEFREQVTQRVRTSNEIVFRLHGLVFARVRLSVSSGNFNCSEQITFGEGHRETVLNSTTEPEIRMLVKALCQRRQPAADKLDPLYRMQPESWLEDQLYREITTIDPHLNPGYVYTQVPAFAGAPTQPDRNMLDLLSMTQDGRLAVIELKATEDPQLALQGLDYWTRVRFHHRQNPDLAIGLGEFQRHGYFGGIRLSADDPRLYLVAPALHIHPATEVILQHLSKRVEWTLVALDERWREEVKIVFRKRSTQTET